MKHVYALLLGLLISSGAGFAQTLSGRIVSGGQGVEGASIRVKNSGLGTVSDSVGFFRLVLPGEGLFQLQITSIGYDPYEESVQVRKATNRTLHIDLSLSKSDLNEVVITGVSRATGLREYPLAAVSISRKALEQSTENNLVDALVKQAPGLMTVKTGPNVSKPFIRGLGYNRVLTLYDGIRQEGQQWGDEHGIEVDAYNVDRAEVIKGPASLLYGSDALAGVVSFFPPVPNREDGRIHGKVTSECQTNNNLIGNGLRLEYSGNHFRWALRGSHRMAKNYRNAVDGRVYNSNFTETNASLLLGYKATGGDSYLNLTLYNNLQGIPDGSRDSLTRQFTKQVLEQDNDDVKNRPLVTAGELNTYRLSPLHQHIQHYRVYTKHDYRMGDGRINLLLALQQNDRQEYNHPTRPKLAGMNVRLNTLNYGIRYDASALATVALTVGVNGMLQQNKSREATDFPIPDYNLQDGGIYVYGKWKNSRWTLSGGGRYDLRQVSWDDFYVRPNSSTGFDERVYGADTAGASLPFAAYKKTFSGLSASLGATYQVSQQISLKANIGRGYRSPNITEMASNGLDPGAHIIYIGNRFFKPEFSWQQDLGINARFRDASAEINLFQNRVENYIYLTLLADDHGNAIPDAQGNRTYQYQQAAAQLYGMEAWISLHPHRLKGFRWDNRLSLVYGINKKEAFEQKGNNGEYLPLIPPLLFYSTLARQFSLSKGKPVTLTPRIELEQVAAQNRYLGLNNSETLTPGYSLVNLCVSASFSTALTLVVGVNNVFDTLYQSHLSRVKYFEHFSESPTGALGIYNMGRNTCLKMVYTF